MFNVQEHTQSIINFEIKNIFKTENEYDYNDYPSDLEISPELGQLNNLDEKSINNNNKLLGKKKERTINLNESEEVNIKTFKDEKAENDFNINNKRNKKCYYIKHGDKRRFRKILKKYTKNNMNNSSLINNKNYIPNSIIDLYEYDINDYFGKEDQQENEKVEESTPDKIYEEKKSLINEVYYNLLSLKNNYNQEDGEKVINIPHGQSLKNGNEGQAEQRIPNGRPAADAAIGDFQPRMIVDPDEPQLHHHIGRMEKEIHHHQQPHHDQPPRAASLRQGGQGQRTDRNPGNAQHEAFFNRLDAVRHDSPGRLGYDADTIYKGCDQSHLTGSDADGFQENGQKVCRCETAVVNQFCDG